MEKEIKLVATKVRVDGLAMIRDWYGDIGCIKMIPFDIPLDKINDSEFIKGNLNDGEFGVQEILGARVDKCIVYNEPDLLGGDYLKFYSSEIIGEFEPMGK